MNTTLCEKLMLSLDYIYCACTNRPKNLLKQWTAGFRLFDPSRFVEKYYKLTLLSSFKGSKHIGQPMVLLDIFAQQNGDVY